jgi:xylulokinase
VSLIGVDVGSSAVKIGVYSEEGKLIALTRHAISPLHPEPGLWETDPEDIWQAFSQGISRAAAQEAVRQDPPIAMAISASGRENFLADAHGNPLSNGVMGADIRGAEFEAPPEGTSMPEPWCLSCGHSRLRMDPVFRLEWWKKYHPEVVSRAKYFLGWIDFLTYRMTGRVVLDHSTASSYMVYDLATKSWDRARAAEYDIPPDMLPELLPWGTVIGEMNPALAEDWGLPSGIKVAQGCNDLNCAAYGAGAYDVGTVCLVSGSYENILVPTGRLPSAATLLRGLNFMPQPCETGLSAIAVHPTGNAVLNWSRDLVGTSIKVMEEALQKQPGGPGPAMAVPHLSGSMAYWEDGRKAKGGLMGLTLATSKAEVVQAFMESIAYDTANTFSMMRDGGIEIDRIRITGGGSRSEWWTQLKADVINKPIEVVEHREPGTLGAALLAGFATRVYDDMEEASRAYSGTESVYTPNPERAALHQERFEAYNRVVATLLEHVY